MTVRAKFKVQRIEATQQQRYPRKEDGKPDYDHPETVEMRTVVLGAVYGDGNPDHENTKFWAATPSGEIRLGTINPEAWQAFDLGVEIYVDFTPAE